MMRCKEKERVIEDERERITQIDARSVSLNIVNMITIRDVEDSISHFSGDDQIKIE